MYLWGRKLVYRLVIQLEFLWALQLECQSECRSPGGVGADSGAE